MFAQYLTLQQLDSSAEKYHHILSTIYDAFSCNDCFIGQFDLNGNVDTVHYLHRGKLAQNFTYSLAGTPCAEAFSSDKVCMINQVQQAFPEDTALVELNANGYVGITLRSFQGKPIGILVCLFDKDVTLTQQERDWLTEQSLLAGTELNTEISADALDNSLEQLEAGEILAKLGSFVWNIDTQQISGTKGFFSLLGFKDGTQEISAQELFRKTEEKTYLKFSKSLENLLAGNIEQASFSFCAFIDEQPRYFQFKVTVAASSIHTLVKGTLQDITERENLYRQLSLSNTVFEQVTEAIMVTDHNNEIIEVNSSFELLTGYSKAEVIGRKPDILSSGQTPPEVYKDMWQSLRTKGCWKGEINNRRKNGDIFPEELSLTSVLNENKELTHYIAVFRDISDWKQKEKELVHYANNDSLTGLANRRSFISSVEHQLKHMERFDEFTSILFIDIDRFKEINDVYGHSVGDEFLVEVARRIRGAVRSQDIVCRYGGDEFTILLVGAKPSIAGYVADKIQEQLKRPFTLRDLSLEITSSIGITEHQPGQSATDMLKNANYAMYSVKKSGRNGIGFHDKNMQIAYLNKLNLRDRLKQAIEAHQLTLHYQPIIDAQVQRIVKFEALVRWFDPEFGFVSPSEFIPVAEEFGLIGPLGQFVLEQACRDLKHIKQQGFEEICFSINRSVSEFRQDNFQINSLSDVLNKTGLSGNDIVIEVTESVAMSSNTYVKEVLAAMKNMKVRIALDDFCTGASSLGNLVEYQPDILKIDKSYIDDLLTDDSKQILISTLITLADKLGMEVIAEGVETKQQLDALCKLGCHYIQGYFYSPALPIEKCLTMLAELNQ